MVKKDSKGSPKVIILESTGWTEMVPPISKEKTTWLVRKVCSKTVGSMAMELPIMKLGKLMKRVSSRMVVGFIEFFKCLW